MSRALADLPPSQTLVGTSSFTAGRISRLLEDQQPATREPVQARSSYGFRLEGIERDFLRSFFLPKAFHPLYDFHNFLLSNSNVTLGDL